jgi:hypothetical protein
MRCRRGLPARRRLTTGRSRRSRGHRVDGHAHNVLWPRAPESEHTDHQARWTEGLRSTATTLRVVDDLTRDFRAPGKGRTQLQGSLSVA